MTDPLGELKQALRQAQAPTSPIAALPAKPDFTYAVARFLASWAQAGRFGPDQAVLLRQTLRWSPSPSLLVGARPSEHSGLLRHLPSAGVEWDWAGQMSVGPYAPSWLNESPPCDASPIHRSCYESFAAEDFLRSVGYAKWLSPSQKEAAWSTLQAPAGSTRVIVLPTGSGKSLCFQLLPRFTAGLTVVVVPTIALAIDQQCSAARLFAGYPDVNPRYFAADDDAEATLAAVEEKRTRLLFTSPEACVSGRLRPRLNKFAEEGWLANLVVDEAHLIETWGAQFRVEFQILAAARRVWRASSGNKLRTFLFSATMTPQCRELMHKLFSNEGEPGEFVCQRLRPEIQYYSHQFSSKPARDDAILEALWHLPRPAILYVTEKVDAERFVARLRLLGFQRLDSFHGDTNRHDRRDILRRWKNNEIDLIVATSAFGVGVDKSDIRAVVHACYPETLDRYYQEIGRGGRDGWSSVSLLLLAPPDRKTAESITVSLMTPEMIQKRWTAMFEQAEYKDHLYYVVPVGARRGELLGTRTYRENIRWNKRLLLQLERAGLLEFADLELRPAASPDDEPVEWAYVKLKFPPHTQNLARLIEAVRNEEVTHFRDGLDKLNDFLTGKSCSGRVIGRLYGMASDQRACPGCPRCRRLALPPGDFEPLAFPEAQPPILKPRSEWVEGLPAYSSVASKVAFVDAISRCVTIKRLRQFYCASEHFTPVLRFFNEAFPSNTLELQRLDPLTSSSKLSSAAVFPVVFLHFWEVNSLAIELGRPFPSVHLFSGGPTGNGRDIVVNEGFRRWASIDAWLPEPPDNSLPCSPTIQ